MNTTKIETIYLDLDGVCCDFFGAVFRTMGNGFPPDHWPQRGADLPEVFGMPEPEFWYELHRRNPDLWATMDEFPWFNTLHRGLSAIAPVVFLSAPAVHADSVAGKVRWLQQRFGPLFEDYIITARKADVGRKGRLLVDDDPLVCKEFQRSGGMAIVFPQPWNDAPGSPADLVRDVGGWLLRSLSPTKGRGKA